MRRFAIAIADANVIIAYGEGYEPRCRRPCTKSFRNWRPGQHGPECICDYFVTGHVLRDKVLPRGDRDHQRGCSLQYRLKEHAGLE